MNRFTARRVAAGAMVAVLALTVQAAPGWAAEEAKPAAPIFRTEAPTVPQPQITKEEALARLKQYFTLPEESPTLTLEGNLSNRNGHMTWDFMATIHYGNGASGSGIGSVDATTGRILSFNGNTMTPGPIHLGAPAPARPEAEAREKAWKLVAEMYPDQAPDLKLLDPALQGSPYGYYYSVINALADSYQFTWVQHVDGIPFPASSVTVGVNKSTLAYANLSGNLLESISFPAGPAQVDAKTAMGAWTASAQPTLVYVPVMPKALYGPYKATAFRLAYQFTTGQVVDALTGKLVSEPYAYVQPTGAPEAVPAGDVAPLVAAAAPLTDADAQRLAADLFGVKGTEGLRNQDSIGGEPNTIQIWLNDGRKGGNASFDRDTGMIRGANRYEMGGPSGMPAPAPGRQVTPEMAAKARQAAIAVVQKYYGPWREQLRLMPEPEQYWKDDAARRFSFPRYVDGVRVSSDMVGVTIDLATMEWRDMNASWTNGVAFPSAVPHYSAAEAAAAYFAGRQPMLIYRPIQPERDPMSYELPQPKAAQLVYMLAGGRSDASLIDAQTGTPLGWDGRDPAMLEAAYKQIQGHWAEGELRYMLASQAVDVAALSPDGPMTRAQAVQMLLQRQSQIFGRDVRPVKLPYTDVPLGDPFRQPLEMAYKEGWLTPGAVDNRFQPDQPVTRAQFAVWAARALGLGDLARSPLTVVPAFADLKGLFHEEVNAIHFLRSLGIVNAADRFRPFDTLTQAEGAAITARIFNYLLAK